MFGAVSYRVVHAPYYGIEAPPSLRSQLVRALREHPARARATAAAQRAIGQAQGLPSHILDDIERRAGQRLDASTFMSPILVFAKSDRSRRLEYQSLMRDSGAILEALVQRPDVRISESLKIILLHTVHGKATKDAFKGLKETGEALGLAALKRVEKSALALPIHPTQWPAIWAEFSSQHSELDWGEQQFAFRKRLLELIAPLVNDLRHNPPSAKLKLVSVARSRLALLMWKSLGVTPKRQRLSAKEFWQRSRTLVTQKRGRAGWRRFMRTLTPAERREVSATLSAAPVAGAPSTRRGLLLRAKRKLRKALRDFKN